MVAHDACVLHIVADGLLYLAFAFRGVYCLCGTLRDVAGAVELRALPAVPQVVEGYALVAVQR